MTIAKTLFAAAAGALVLGTAALGTAGAANAGGKNWHFKHHWGHKVHFYAAPVYYAPVCTKFKTFDRFGRLIIVKKCGVDYGYYGY